MATLGFASVASPGTVAAQTPTCFGEAATIVAQPDVPVEGTPERDVIVGTPGPDVIRGRGGHDVICGLGGADWLHGNGGNDRINGGGGADEIRGGKDDDALIGSSGEDRIWGNSGDDAVSASKGDDWVSGGPGDDSLRGRSGHDVLSGGDGDDLVRGGSGNDLVRGKAGADDIAGNSGDDRCEPGGGAGEFATCETVEATSTQLLGSLRVAPEDRTGYDRSLFGAWVDLDGDRCDTRQEVLAAESLIPVATADGCRVTGGRWLSRFDDVAVTDPALLEIDHLVALAEAWDSGAGRWDFVTRRAFANDQGDPRTLSAVTASSNGSKSDGDPADWLPPAGSYRCTYVQDWIAVKTRWSLPIDAGEREALESALVGCSQPSALVEKARVNFVDDTPDNPGDARNCGDFDTYAQAKAWFDRYYLYYGDIAGLDGNGDGIPCEGLPGAP